MIRSRMMWSVLVGCALVVGCEKKDETPTGAKANVPEATEKSADMMKKKTEDASESAKSAADAGAKDAKAAADAGAKDAKKQAEAASDALKKNAGAAAEAVNNNTASADSANKLQQVMDAIKDKKWDIAETTLKGLEANKASLPAALQGQVDNARKLLDAGKTGLAAPAVPALPK